MAGDDTPPPCRWQRGSRLATVDVGLEHEIKWSLVVSAGAQYRLYCISGFYDPAWSPEEGVAQPASIQAAFPS
jgi:hypothetical protein